MYGGGKIVQYKGRRKYRMNVVNVSHIPKNPRRHITTPTNRNHQIRIEFIQDPWCRSLAQLMDLYSKKYS